MDVLIVGGGPAGLSTARQLKGALVLEEDPDVGVPRHCTSIVSRRGAEEADIPKSLWLATYDTIRITDLSREVIFTFPNREIVLIDRPGLERHLSTYADVRTRERALSVTPRVSTKRGVYRADTVVLAEGARTALSRGLVGKMERLSGLQVDVRMRDGPEEITVIVNRAVSSTYFGWVVPLGDGTYRVGLADAKDVKAKLDLLLRLFRAVPIDRPFGGVVLRGPMARRLVYGNVAVVGDAAGMVKPLSGGGIVMSMIGGRMLADAVKKGDLARYDSSVRERYRVFTLLSRALADVLYRQRMGERLLQEFAGERLRAVDYDNHLKTLVMAPMGARGMLRLARNAHALVAALMATFRLVGTP